jgi:antitoxin component YwqK of YwqJK toxin-antitoxin module
MITLTGIFYNTMNTPCLENKLLPVRRFFVDVVRIVSVILLPIILFVSCQKTDKAYYPHGQVKFILPKDSRGQINGEAKWWYENGSMMLTAEYKNGELNGKLTRFYENGNKQTEDNYLKGRLNGISKEMDMSGKLMSEMTYINDILNGPSRKLNELGQILEEGSYKNGYYEGEWKYYDRFGKLIGTANFSHGNGIKKSWNANGKIAMTAEYHDNLIHGSETWFDESGQKIRVRTYISGEIVSERLLQPGQQ